MWTEERVELLKKLWSEGLSASQVAKQLGGVTRNAVIGKVHRLGLSGRATPSRPARTSRPAAPRTLVRARPEPATPREQKEELQSRSEDNLPKENRASNVSELPDLPLSERATVLTLTERTCKWPIGEPGKAGFHFCGRGAEDGMPYCPEHARKAYQPAQSRRNRERARTDRLTG